jgi:PAS domain-containing protein
MMRGRMISGMLIGIFLLIIGIAAIRVYIRHLRRTIHSEQEFFGDVIEYSGMIVWAVHADKRVVRFNQYAAAMTGLSEKDVLDVRLDEISGLGSGTEF